MKELHLPILWKGTVVGVISNLKSDNFDVYGKWIPGDGPSTRQFVDEIEMVGEAVVRIGLNEPRWIGTVETVPDDEIEIKSRPNMTDEG